MLACFAVSYIYAAKKRVSKSDTQTEGKGEVGEGEGKKEEDTRQESRQERGRHSKRLKQKVRSVLILNKDDTNMRSDGRPEIARTPSERLRKKILDESAIGENEDLRQLQQSSDSTDVKLPPENEPRPLSVACDACTSEYETTADNENQQKERQTPAGDKMCVPLKEDHSVEKHPRVEEAKASDNEQEPPRPTYHGDDLSKGQKRTGAGEIASYIAEDPALRHQNESAANASSRPGAFAVPGPEAGDYDQHNVLSRHVTVSPVANNPPVNENSAATCIADSYTIDSAFLAEPQSAVVIDRNSEEEFTPSPEKDADEERSCCIIRTLCLNLECKYPKKTFALRSFCGLSVAIVLVVLILAGLRVFDPHKNTCAGLAAIENYYDDGSVCCIQKLLPHDSSAEANFGQDIALDDNTLLVAVERPDDETKCAYIFTKGKDGVWAEKVKFAPNATVDQGFSLMSVALSGNTAMIGQSGDDPNGIRSGSVFVYSRDASGQWKYDDTLIPDDGAEEDMFGFSVDIDRDLAIIGAAHKHDRKDISSTHGDAADYAPDDRSHDGSAYVFARRQGTWEQEAKLTAPNGNFQDRFGFSVAISGNTVLVCSDAHAGNVTRGGGAGYVYSRNDTTWTLEAILYPHDLRKGDHFGSSVDLDGDMAIIGAKFHDHIDSDIDSVSGYVPRQQGGSAYIFKRQGSSWFQEAELLASDGEEDDTFGHSVAISVAQANGKSNAVVGAWKDADIAERSGAAYVFSRLSNGTWAKSAKIAPMDLGRKFYFGGAVAIDSASGIVLAGAGAADGPNGPRSGAVYSIKMCNR